jgi:hypothetical protein
MSDDKTLELLIKLGVIGKDDVVAANQLLAESRKGTEQMATAEKEATAATEHGLESKRELRRILFDVGNVVAPGAGRALMELAVGPIGAVLALTMAFEALRKKIEDTEKQADDLDAKEFTAHQNAIAAVRQAWIDAGTELQKYDIAVAEAGQSKDPAADRLKRIQEVSAAETAAHLKRMEELDKEAIAYLRAHGASPKVIAQTEEAQRRQMDAAKDAAAQRSIDQIKADIAERQQTQPFYDASAAAAKDRSAAADARLKRANQDKQAGDDALSGGVLDRKISAAQAVLDRKQADLKTAVAGMGPAGLSGAGKEALDTMRDETAKAQQALDGAIAEKERAQRGLDAANAAIAQATQEKTAADAERARVEAAGRENSARITQEQNEVQTKTAVLGQNQTDQAKEDILHSPAGRLPYTFEQLAKATGRSNEQIETLLKNIIEHHTSLNAVLNMMAGQVAQLMAEHRLTKD